MIEAAVSPTVCRQQVLHRITLDRFNGCGLVTLLEWPLFKHRADIQVNPTDRQLMAEDRGREGLPSSPPSELCMRFSRTQLSSW